MNGLAQTLHIARKDLSEFRWIAFAYLVLVAVATAHADSMRPGDTVLDLSMFFVATVGMLLVAILVQADSPGRIDAFWSTRPFRPLAVLAAKILLAAIVVLGVGLAGQAIALTTNGVRGTAVVARLSASAGIYGEWLLTAMVIAAITRDLKSFVVVLVCIPIALALINLAWASVSFGSESANGFSAVGPTEASGAPVTIAWWWFGIVACFVVLLLVYRAREIGRGPRALAVVIGACAILTTGLTVTIGPPKDASPGVPRAVIAGSLSPEDSTHMTVSLRAATAARGERITLLHSSVALTLRDGSTLRVDGPSSLELGATHPDLPGVRWLTPNADAGSAALRTSLSPDVRAQLAMERGVTRVALSGRVQACVPRVRGSVPLAKGALLTRDGRRTEIVSWSYASGAATIDLRSKAVARNDESASPPGWTDVVVYALVNDARHEALPLHPDHSGVSEAWFVLPGTTASLATDTLTSRNSLLPHNGARDEGWFRGARLVVIDWVPLGSYPVSAAWAVP